MVNQEKSSFAPSAPKGDSDLYAQIAAGDEEEQKQVRAQSSFLMNLMIAYMRLTLSIDSKRRQYQNVFRILGGIWAVFMILLYLSGGIMLLIMIGSYMRFPTEIQKYLNENGIICDKMDIPGYIISQVELKGIHDKDNTYHIDNLNISSTFADFLNRRARSVSVKGVKLTIDANKGNDAFFLALSKLRKGDNDKAGLRIDSLEVSNAVVTFKGKDYALPVTLSLGGVYGNETNITAYISVDEPSLKISGPLTIRSIDSGLEWNLSIVSGQVAFPGRPMEKVKGTVGIKTKGQELTSLSTNVSLLFNQARRNIFLTLDKKKDLFSGKLSLAWIEGVDTPQQREQTKLDFNLSGLKLSADGDIQTNDPIYVSLSSNYSSDLKVTALSGTLTGELTCQLFDTCLYRLDKPAVLGTKSISVRDQGYEVNSKSRFQFMLEPTQKFVDISFKTGIIDFDFNTKDFVFNGEQVGTKGDVILKARKGNATGYLNLWDKDIVAKVSLDGFSYQNPFVDLKQGRLVSENIFDDNARVFLSAPSVTLNGNTAIKVPFELSYDRNNGVSNISALLENKQVQLLFAGAFDWNSGYINGQLVIPTVDLGGLWQPLNRISDIIPPDFKKTFGKLAAYGSISGNLYSGLTGPFYLSLSDFGFETDQLEIKDLNTVLSLQSLVPLVTDSEQEIYIGDINSVIPISNVDIILKAEDNYAQVKELSADVAGIRLNAGETVVPYKNIGTLIYLRNQDEDLTGIMKVNKLKDWKNIGSIRGSILFPLEIKDMSLSIKNAILQLFGAELEYVGNASNKPKFLDKNTKIEINSGTVTVDTSEQTKKSIKVSVLLDTVLLPSRLKKTLRHVFPGKLSDVMTFRSSPAAHVSPDLMSQIRHIQNQANKFRVK